MGCQLIVTPNIHSEVIRRAVGYGMTVCPGCATATEAFTALDAGAQALKIFPSSAFGPQYIKALKAVLPPNIAVFAVGGVTPENLAQWIDAGCAGAGLGSDLYRAGQSVERTAQQAANIPVIGFWSAIHQSIKSGITTGHRGLCRWRCDARKPGAVDRCRLCRSGLR